MNWGSYRVGRKHEKEAIKNDLMKLIEDKKTKDEIIEFIRKL